jgi:hypothetical protein
MNMIVVELGESVASEGIPVAFGASKKHHLSFAHV